MAARPAGGSRPGKPGPRSGGSARPAGKAGMAAARGAGQAAGGQPQQSRVRQGANMAKESGRKAAKTAIAGYTGGTGTALLAIIPSPLDSPEERKKKWRRLLIVFIALILVIAMVAMSAVVAGMVLTSMLAGGNATQRPESAGTCLSMELEQAGGGADAPRPTRGDGQFGYPVKPEIPITSGFGPRWGTNHNGTDFGNPEGGDLYAVADGEIVQAGPAKGFDHWIVLRVNVGDEMADIVYGHEDADTVGVKVGDKVKAGDVIGQTGQTDANEDATAPHLHLEVHPGGWGPGNAVDPEPYLDKMRAMKPTEGSGGGGASGEPGSVTVIGDSITEASKAKISEKASGANIDSKVGRQFSEGLDILKGMSDEDKGDTIAFPLGTNGPFTDGDVQALLDAAGERAVVLMTVGGPGVSAASQVNPVVEKAASDHADQITVADWGAKVDADPELLGPDGVHPSEKGQQVFADTLAEAIGGSGGGGPPAGGEDADDGEESPAEPVSAETSEDSNSDTSASESNSGEVTAADWEKLAQCESGGKWDIDTGNSFKGGLQFTDETWAGMGGTEYAENANEATKEQQMEVANRVLAEQGWGAWPACTNGPLQELKGLKPAPEGTFVDGSGDTSADGGEGGGDTGEAESETEGLQSKLDGIVDAAKGNGVDLGVATGPVGGGTTMSAGTSGDEVYAASTIKVAIASTVEDKLKQDDTVTVSPDDVVGGTGSGMEAGEYPVSELEQKMITLSDNTATNALIDAVGGFDPVNDMVSKAGVDGGYSLGNKMMAEPGPTRSMISAEGANEFLQSLWEASQSDGGMIDKDQASRIIDLMKQQTVRSKLPVDIPEGKVANKTGENDGVSHDIGFIWPDQGAPMSVAVTSSFTSSQDDANSAIAEVGKAVFDAGAEGSSSGDGDDLQPAAPSVGSEEGLQTDAVRGMRLVAAKFPEVEKIEGHRPDDPSPDVASGRAIDVMVPAGERGAPLGDSVADLFTENADELHVKYVQWNKKIWDGGKWDDAPKPEDAPDSRVRITFQGGGAPNEDSTYKGIGDSGEDTSAADPNPAEGDQLSQNLNAEQQANIKAIIVAAKKQKIEPAERAAALGVMLSGYSSNFTNLSADEDPNKVGIFGESPFGGKTPNQLMNVEATAKQFMSDLDNEADKRDTWATDKASDVIVAVYPERASLAQELDKWESMSTEIVKKLWDDPNAQKNSRLEKVGDDAEDCSVGAPTSSAGLNEGEVPPEFVPWLKRAGELCEGIDAPLLAAQIEAESNFQQHGHNDAGAAGITQFIDSTWNNQYGKKVDDEGNAIGPPGSGDRNDIGDAVMAQGNYMCDIRKQIDGWIKNGEVTGDITELSLAGYNAGEPAVHSAGGMPSGGEYTTQTQPYVKKIMAARDKYAAVGESGGKSPKSSKSKSGKSGDGSIGAKALESARKEEGKPYGWGATGPDAWDCSSLVQKAYRDQGIELPRVTYDQIKEGEEIPIEDAKPGDLIFSNFSSPGVPEHVSMYVSPTRHYEAQTTGVPVGEHDMWADDMIVKRVY